jgi:hypothetical protein
MSVSYSPALGLALPANGTETGTWGDLTNTNFGTLVEQAITGVLYISMTAGSVTLTSTNGVVNQSRNAVIVATGTQVVTNSITIPNTAKTYLVNNTSSFQINIQVSGGSSYTCPVGTISTVYCDGLGVAAGASINPSIYQTFVNPLITGIRETTTISATAATGTINFNTLDQAILYYISNASANWTVNFRGNGSTTLNSLMATGQSFTATFMVTQGATPYYNNVVQVDGSSVTPKWQGGTAPASGNANSIDVYTYAIIKTGSAAFTVLASQTRFA